MCIQNGAIHLFPDIGVLLKSAGRLCVIVVGRIGIMFVDSVCC